MVTKSHYVSLSGEDEIWWDKMRAINGVADAELLRTLIQAVRRGIGDGGAVIKTEKSSAIVAEDAKQKPTNIPFIERLYVVGLNAEEEAALKLYCRLYQENDTDPTIQDEIREFIYVIITDVFRSYREELVQGKQTGWVADFTSTGASTIELDQTVTNLNNERSIIAGAWLKSEKKSYTR